MFLMFGDVMEACNERAGMMGLLNVPFSGRTPQERLHRHGGLPAHPQNRFFLSFAGV